MGTVTDPVPQDDVRNAAFEYGEIRCMHPYVGNLKNWKIGARF